MSRKEKEMTENTMTTSQGTETLYSIGELAAAVKTVFGKDMTPDQRWYIYITEKFMDLVSA